MSHGTSAVTVAVTGAGGFLGGHVCRALAARGRRVIGVARTGSLRGLPAGLAGRVETRRGDVRDKASLTAALRGADAVIHCAALVTIDNSARARADTMTVNGDGTRNTLAACFELGIERLTHISSLHAYARMRGAELNGDSALASASSPAYSSAKAAGHAAVLRAMSEGRIGGCIICPGGIIGPGDDRPSAVGGMILDIERRKLPMLINEGFWWCDARDVAEAAAAAVTRGGDGRLYFTPGRYAKLARLAEIISDELGYDVTRPAVPYWAAMAGLPAVQAYAAARGLSPLYTRASLELLRNCPASVDDAGAVRCLGYAARPLEETIRDALAWFRENGDLA